MTGGIEDGFEVLSVRVEDSQLAASLGRREIWKPAMKTVPDSQDNFPCDRGFRSVESPVGRRCASVSKPLYTTVEEGHPFIGQAFGLPLHQLRESD